MAAGLTQSTSGTPLLRFLKEMYDAGAAGAYDAIAVHAYGADDEATVKRVEGVRAAMTARGRLQADLGDRDGLGSSGAASDFVTDESGQATALGCAVARLGEARDRLGLGHVVQYDWKDDRARPRQRPLLVLLRAAAIRRFG